MAAASALFALINGDAASGAVFKNELGYKIAPEGCAMAAVELSAGETVMPAARIR